MRTWIRAAAGAVAGAVAGLIVTVGVLTARARIWGVYLSDPGDALGWALAPLAVGLLGGSLLGRRGGPLALGTLLGTVLGLGAGVPLGAAVGVAVARHPEIAWTGATIGAAVGVVAGACAGILWGSRRGPSVTPKGGDTFSE